jgi:large subunit ribosomal protein L30
MAMHFQSCRMARTNLSTLISSSSSRQVCRTFASSTRTLSESNSTSPPKEAEPNTHYKITLRRSAIALGERKQGTLAALGIHRRHQTVYHAHSPDIAGKILSVKELLEVENVPTSAVRTKEEQRQERKASRGFVVDESSLKSLDL